MAVPNGGTNFGSGYGPVEVFFKNTSGNVIAASTTAVNIPSAVDGYAVACVLRVTDTGQMYINVGTTASCAFVVMGGGSSTHPIKSAIPSTATATAAQVATGYITTTSAATTTITLPTGALLGPALNATQGTVFDLIVDNTAGANVVTMAVATNGILSDAATGSAASFGDLTIAAGVTGLARYTLMFSSATAYVFTRTA